MLCGVSPQSVAHVLPCHARPWVVPDLGSRLHSRLTWKEQFYTKKVFLTENARIIIPLDPDAIVLYYVWQSIVLKVMTQIRVKPRRLDQSRHPQSKTADHNYRLVELWSCGEGPNQVLYLMQLRINYHAGKKETRRKIEWLGQCRIRALV